LVGSADLHETDSQIRSGVVISRHGAAAMR